MIVEGKKKYCSAQVGCELSRKRDLTGPGDGGQGAAAGRNPKEVKPPYPAHPWGTDRRGDTCILPPTTDLVISTTAL